MEIPPHLINEVRGGRVVLVLGAGASFGASDPNGQGPPLGNDLRDRLSDAFLGGGFKTEALDYVAALATSEADLSRVQDFIADQFRHLAPAAFHSLIPTFTWRGIATTNYDYIVERSYDACKERVQDLVPFISNDDRVDEKLRSQRHLAYLKLHGCITRTHDPDTKLILTTEDFLNHRAGRSRLYDVLKDWAYECPLLFVGHRLADYDLRALLQDLADVAESRPRFYLVRPAAEPAEVRFWEQKRITLISAGFEELLIALDNAIPRTARVLAAAAPPTTHAIQQRFRVRESPSDSLVQFLATDADYLSGTMAIDPGDPARFYRGFDLGWYAIERNLDVRRGLTETLLREIIIRPEEDRPSPTEAYVIKAEAGAGKTLFLRRLAWESARDVEALCIVLKKGRVATIDALAEVSRCTEQRIFLFWDDAADHALEIRDILAEATRRKLALTLFTAERLNAWNMSCEDLDAYMSGSYPLRYLNHAEIEQLVKLLDEHRCLGQFLEKKSPPERVKEFEQRAGRQILVALHEATLGRPFEEILLDEYREIQPDRARALYLSVCVLNRLNVPVRAGLISRVHGIGFADFRERFLAPLDHVVRASADPITKDYHYIARHPEIAEIVFREVLQDARERYYEYLRVLRELNLAYSSDESAFRQMIRARTLHDLFPNHEDVVAIYEIARGMAANDAYVLQQLANYERIRPNGNLTKARELLDLARQMTPRDPSLMHSMAEVARAQALAAPTPLARERLRKEARAAVVPLLNNRDDSYARHTLVKLSLDNLKDVLADSDSPDQALDPAIRDAEASILEGVQRHPDDEWFHSAEADLSALLKDNDRALRALERASAKNPHDAFIAGRLATMYEERGEASRGVEALRRALEGKPGDRLLNFKYANMLRRVSPELKTDILYHFRRSFSKGDDNHEAQFWFARFAYEVGSADDKQDAKDVFHRLRQVPMKHFARIVVRDRIMEGENLKVFTGTIARIEEEHGFVVRDGSGDQVFFHRNDVEDGIWVRLGRNGRACFGIGFSFGGVKALQIQPL